MTKTSKIRIFKTPAGSRATDNPKIPYIKIEPASRQQWIVERGYGIGASECSKILGASRYGTPLSLFLDKVGLNEPVAENWAMEQGHIFERVVAEKFQEQKGFGVIGISKAGTVKADWLACDRKHPFLRVSPDYLYWLKDEDGNDMTHNFTNRGVLECKTSVHHYTPDCIKDECISWYCQVQYQMHVLGLKESYLGFLCVDSLTGGECWFQKIAYNEKFCADTLIPAIVSFWQDHVAPAMRTNDRDRLMEFAPEPSTADDVTRRYTKEEAGKSISAADIDNFFQQLASYHARKAAIKEMEAELAKFEEQVKLKMKDSESIVDADNKVICTFKASKPSISFDSKRFKSECPDLYEQYCCEKPGSRRLIFK